MTGQIILASDTRSAKPLRIVDDRGIYSRNGFNYSTRRRGMTALRLLMLAAASTSLASCGTMMGRPEVQSFSSDRSGLPTPSALVQPANVRSAYLVNGKLCPEPPPDAALAASAEATAKVTANASTSVEGSGKVATSVLQLAGRTQTVLVARDLLYNLCILKMNGFYDKDAYFKAAEVIGTLAEAAKASADADSKNATAEVVKSAIEAQKTGDPKIIALATENVTTMHTNADAVVARFTRGDGEILTADLAKFAAPKGDVEKLLGPAMAKTLGGEKSRDDLRNLLYHTLHDSAGDLAALAAAFKG